MPSEQEKLLNFLSSLDAQALDYLTRLHHSMKVRAPRPRIGMTRFVLCSPEVLALLKKQAAKTASQLRIAFPEDVPAGELHQHLSLELYEKDGSFAEAIPFHQLDEELAHAIELELSTDLPMAKPVNT